ncbi:MAG TPA: hypothetical protein VML91_01940 [Burkholderiales bacterium]|nr:hypothetical protein [Burkholderiales bacterium]
MSAHEVTASAELVQFTRAVSAARGLNALVCTQHDLRAALGRSLVSRQWSQLDEAQRQMAGSPALAARFEESLRSVLEAPEFGAHESGARWRGLVLTIPVSLTARSGTLVSLPQEMAGTLRASLQQRFPADTAIRLVNRLVPQLVAHTMGVQSLYELIEELASGERGGPEAPEADTGVFAPEGRSLGQHYFFALALTTRLEQVGLELPGELRNDPGLIRWAALQTERITSDFAERGWQLLMRVSPPQRLRDMLSSLPVLGDVRELDGLLEHAATRHGTPVAMLRADLAPPRGGDAGLRIAISDRRDGRPLARALYRLAALGAEAGAYRVAVRLASAGVELAAADESLNGAVRRAMTLTSAPVPPEPAMPGVTAAPHTLGFSTLRSRFSRSHRHST